MHDQLFASVLCSRRFSGIHAAASAASHPVNADILSGQAYFSTLQHEWQVVDHALTSWLHPSNFDAGGV